MSTKQKKMINGFVSSAMQAAPRDATPSAGVKASGNSQPASALAGNSVCEVDSLSVQARCLPHGSRRS